MAEAWISGSLVPLSAAVSEAARLLAASRMPVIAGLGTDVGGARAAIALAERLGAAFDHMHSAALLHDLDVMREAGMMLTTPNELRLRADTVLLIGGGLLDLNPDLVTQLLKMPLGHEAEGPKERRMRWLCPDAPHETMRGAGSITTIGESRDDLPIVLAALRARVTGRPVRKMTIPLDALDTLANELRHAKFGVALWSAAALDSVTVEMLCGLVKDLNDVTRFSGLPLACPDNGAGVLQVSGWLTGFPPRTSFGRGYPEHNPWRFDATRLVDSGEADCAVWISAYCPALPEWQRPIPLIALTTEPARLSRDPAVAIAVGRPGIDHPAVEHLAAAGTLAAVGAEKSANVISVADAVSRIAAALPAPEQRSC